jgi:hypothetical protein
VVVVLPVVVEAEGGVGAAVQVVGHHPSGSEIGSGYSLSALTMNFCQIWAGKLPPVTLMLPWTSVMGICPWG